MELSLAQARLALPKCRPNPAVGAVIVGICGAILGVGHTQSVGSDHAEISALKNAELLGNDVTGATIFVTLEPCSHQGRTGPCTLALINAKISKVVASIQDPNPMVSGKGFQALRDAGLEVIVGPGHLESKEINQGFFSRYLRGTPWVRLKVASSMDGRTSLTNGQSQWITGPAARKNGHAWRANAAAILTGIGTILTDNPRFDTRGSNSLREPVLVIVDSALRTPTDAKLFDFGRPVLIFTTKAESARSKELEAKGATIILSPESQFLKSTVDLNYVLSELVRREIDELHVEAGATLNGSLLKQGLVDEIIWYVAPKILGTGAPIADIGTLQSIPESNDFRFVSVEIIDEDMCVISRRIDSQKKT